MKTIFEISTTNGQFYYDMFYMLAIVFAGVFFMLDGRRKNYPMAEWSLIFTSGIIFLIVGTKLLTYTPDDWKIIFNTHVFPYTERKTILGGIAGAIIGIWIAKKLIRFPHPVLDSFAVSFPLAMAIQRIGCLLVGCCYGTPTNVPWAISYSCSAAPYYHHLNHGLIAETACSSLPVHPNQLYQTILCLLIAGIVWLMKNFWRRPGNLFFTSITMYLVARFMVEFWRDGVTNGISGVEWMGLKYVQWALLMAICFLFAFILIREHVYKQKEKVAAVLVNPVWYFILLCLFVLAARYWFTKTEFLFIELVFLPATLLQVNKILRQHAEGFGYRLASVFSLLLVFILNGTVTAQKAYEDYNGNKTLRGSFSEVSFGYGYFQYSHYHSTPKYYNSQGCFDPGHYEPVGPEFVHNSNVFGGGITHVKTIGKYQKLTLTGELSAGWDVAKDVTPQKIINIYDVAPSIRYDFKWLGVGLGFHTGSALVKEESLGGMLYTNEDKTAQYTNWSGSIRLLPYHIFYTELRYNVMFPYQIGHKSANAAQFVLGTGFGLTNGSVLELGYDGNTGTFISAKALLFKKYGIKASYYGCTEDRYIHQMMQVSVSYRFNKKEWQKTVVE